MYADEARTHDGFHLVIGVGPAYQNTSASFDPEPAIDADLSLSGIGFAAAIMAGATVADGLVLGDALMGTHSPSPTVKIGEVEVEPDADMVGLVVGPYADYYFDPQGGLHVFVQAGLATMQDADEDSDGVALGFGAGLGVGYDVFISDKWSLGGLVRFHYLRTSDDLPGDARVTYGTIVSALNLVVVRH